MTTTTPRTMPSTTRSTAAAAAEESILLVYDLRDALMKRHQYTEATATEVAQLCVHTLSQLSDDELIEVKRRVKRLQRQQRDERIRAAMRRGNAEEIARAEGISRRRVYEVAGAK